MTIKEIKSMEDSTLNWILWAWAMGWSAVLKLKTGTEFTAICTGSTDFFFGFRDSGFQMPLMADLSKGLFDGIEYEITGYLYAGELAGNEPIPEGQKFRVKKTGEVLPLENATKDAVILKRKEHPWLVSASKSEIEPYFE